jgi:hypothetical protein
LELAAVTCGLQEGAEAGMRQEQQQHSSSKPRWETESNQPSKKKKRKPLQVVPSPVQ